MKLFREIKNTWLQNPCGRNLKSNFLYNAHCGYDIYFCDIPAMRFVRQKLEVVAVLGKVFEFKMCSWR